MARRSKRRRSEPGTTAAPPAVEGGGRVRDEAAPGVADARRPPAARTLALLLPLLVLLVLWAHSPALGARALSFDDASYLTQNPLVRSPGWASVKRFFGEVLEPSTVRGYYQPLAMTSLMLDSALGGSPEHLRPYHRTSLLLHVLNTVLVALLLASLFGDPWIAVLLAGLFGAHPLTVEPIPWVGERKTLLAAFFVLGALLAYVGYTRRASRTCWLASLVLFVLALLSKPTSTPLPVLLLLLDVWPLERVRLATLRARVVEKLPFLAVAAVSAWITYESQRRTAGATLPGDVSAAHSPFRIPLIICHNIVFYLLKIVWPANLSSHYPVPEPLSLARPMVLLGVAGTLVLIPLLVLSLRRTRALLVGWLFFFVAIFPTLGVIGFTNVIASDKYAYLPSVGLLIALAGLLVGLVRRARAPGDARRLRLAMATICGLLAVLEGAAARAYYAQWSDSERLLRHMLRLAPESPEVLNALGSHLAQLERVDEATELYRRALRVKPDSIAAHINLGQAYFLRRRHAEAAAEFEAALALGPQPGQAAYARGNLGVSLKQLGRADEAAAQYREAIRLDPTYVTPHANLGNLLREQGKVEEAIEVYRAALRLSPVAASVHNGLGVALFALGRHGEASAAFAEAMRLDPRNVEPCMNLALSLAREGETERAVATYRRALALRPGDAALHVSVGNALFTIERLPEAAEAYAAALRIDPASADAKRWLEATQRKLAGATAP